jgi:hypothetical protein
MYVKASEIQAGDHIYTARGDVQVASVRANPTRNTIELVFANGGREVLTPEVTLDIIKRAD